MQEQAKTQTSRKKKHSIEERAAYFRSLRAQWKQAQQWAETQKTKHELLGIQMEVQRLGISCSYNSICFILHQMAALGLSGVPYVDAKTFDGWKDSGFRVRKGEKSVLKGIVWITSEGKEEDGSKGTDSLRLFPKVYHLFHRSQVEEVLQ